MKRLFKWVQLSDVHFQGTTSGFDSETLRDSLPTFLKDNVSGCHALILTGDYRFAPDKEENPKNVANYIRSIAKSLRVGEKIFAVPGNHDLDRSKIRLYTIEGLLKEYTPEKGIIDSEVCSGLQKNFSFYDKLCDDLGIHSVIDSNNPHSFIPLDNCNLLLLNTALTACSDKDPHRLIVGSKYIKALITNSDNNSNPIIAIGHHPLEALNEQEKDTVSTMFERNNIRLYLCGHSHEHKYEPFSENGKEVTVGCLKKEDNSVVASFAVGELYEDGRVCITSYLWDTTEQVWHEMPSKKRDWTGMYPRLRKKSKKTASAAQKTLVNNPLSLVGYNLLGSLGEDGIKYYWQKEGSVIESIAFNARQKNTSKEEDINTSAYTVSTSIGCQLAATNNECIFCETGKRKFVAPLSGEDIALQCIFMAEYDSDCTSWPDVKNHAREFAFMGQGEPGYNYPAIQKAILLNDFVMERLGQKVSRYIISTCGITDLIPALIQDIKKGLFKNKVTVHLSLHDVGVTRQTLMPISRTNDYTEILKQCKSLYNYTKEKIGVGILMFDNYQPTDSQNSFSLTEEKLKDILKELDSKYFRIDLCTVNNTSAGKQQHELSNAEANRLLRIVTDAGFEGKKFTSIARAQNAGCGMLSSEADGMQKSGSGCIEHFNYAVKLLREARDYYMSTL